MVARTTMADYTALSTENVDAHDVNQESASGPLLFGRGSSRSTPYGGSVTILSDSQGYTYSYGPGGLPGLVHNYYALGCAVFASIGGI
jgi:hypothetical protein